MNHETTPLHHLPRPAAASAPVERLREALRYATRPPRGEQVDGRAMLTGLTALSLLGFPGVPVPRALERAEVLVARGRRLPDTRAVAVRRARVLPRARLVGGLPCAPVPRAVADAVAAVRGPAAVRSLLVESVRTGDCEPDAVLRELDAAGLLERAEVADAVDALLAQARAVAQERLYAMVREFALPDPVWNVELALPGGPRLGGVDAYWPRQAVALELDAGPWGADDAVPCPPPAGSRQRLERLGVRVLRTTPAKLRAAPARQASQVRDALMTACGRPPRTYLVVLPR
ncbi:hypothetical protein POF50_027740 [Streptomyces sp. SL13]|uniref:DUF559 domain-containing protein n=1 Tax=Streptantibioticus silvisoli TaxID=2705255 RepID=A0AA90KIV7_9ACTN|nr:hypothetical protein [Streptantibioticus silvisoli]MDI5964752.1 hypothetical protein [Streptantibioticus silvisoli]MDI5973094.1 hypothetical protein [Streptantibioticus silvisoli]